jgi:LPS-assembly lipoprotein
MSLSERLPHVRRSSWMLAGLATIAMSLGACAPLYSSTVNGVSLQDELQAIAIDPVPERLGHYLVNELIFALNGTGSTVTPKYKLTITAKERSQSALMDTVTGRASSGTVLVDATYKLTNMSSGATVTTGTAFVSAAYDRTSQRFSNLRAAREAQIRDAKQLADQIKTRIAAALVAKG